MLTPVTVRRAPDGTGDYLLIKGQGRTLACRLLGIDKIPAIVVDDRFAENEKVQQFLVENVARLRMRPIDRALLIARARQDGEETAEVARRFGVSAATVRRLEAQLEGATSSEVAALKSGNVNLALHAVIARHVTLNERPDVVAAVCVRIRSGQRRWRRCSLAWAGVTLWLSAPEYRQQRLLLLAWACGILDRLASWAAEGSAPPGGAAAASGLRYGFPACVGGPMKLIELELSDLVVSEELSRSGSAKQFEERLKSSIEEIGLAEPIKVAPLPTGKYVVIDGTMRLKAIAALRKTDPSRFLDDSGLRDGLRPALRAAISDGHLPRSLA